MSCFYYCFFFLMRRFNSDSSLFDRSLQSDGSLLKRRLILRRCNIVYGEGQSRVCTWLFRWWFTYILSSWVIEWLSCFPFMRKVPICVRTSCHPFFFYCYPFLNPSPLIVFIKWLHWGLNTESTVAQPHVSPASFPKDLFALQRAHIPLIFHSI